MKKREYLNLLKKQSKAWLRLSIEHPSIGMTPMHIALHKIALRHLNKHGRGF